MLTRTQWNDKIRPEAKSYIFCVLLAVLYWLNLVPVVHTQLPVSDFGIFSPVFSALLTNVTANRIADLVVFLVLSFLILRLNEAFSFIRVRTVLPSVLGIMLGGTLLTHTFSAGLVVCFMLTLVLLSALLLTDGNVQLHAFNIGVMVMLTALVYPWCCTYLLIVFIIYYDFNVLSLRSILATLTGALVPVIYAAIYLGVTDQIDEMASLLDFSIDSQIPDLEFSSMSIAYLVVMVIVTCWALIHNYVSYQQEALRPRRMFSMFVSTMLWSLLMLLFTGEGISMMYCTFIVMGSVVLGRFFSLSVPVAKPYYVAFFVMLGSTVIYYFSLME